LIDTIISPFLEAAEFAACGRSVCRAVRKDVKEISSRLTGGVPARAAAAASAADHQETIGSHTQGLGMFFLVLPLGYGDTGIGLIWTVDP